MSEPTENPNVALNNARNLRRSSPTSVPEVPEPITYEDCIAEIDHLQKRIDNLKASLITNPAPTYGG